MEPPATPRVVAEQHVGAEAPDPGRHLVGRGAVGIELAVHPVEEHDLAGRPEPLGSSVLLVSSGGDQAGRVPFRVPAALRAVGAHEDVDLAAGGGPAGERGTGVELDVVRVGADGQRPGRNRQPGHFDGWNSRSAGSSTSQPRSGSSSRRQGRPRRSASATWRANEPGP